MWVILAANGPVALYSGWLLKRKAVHAGVFPSPISKAFITDLSIAIARRYRRRTPNRTRYQQAQLATDYLFKRTIKRIGGAPVTHYDDFDDFMSRHNLAPLPPLLPAIPDEPEEPNEVQKMIRSIINDPE